MDQYTEVFNNEIFKNESKSCKALSCPSLEVFKEMLKSHISIRVLKGIPKPAGGGMSQCWGLCVLLVVNPMILVEPQINILYLHRHLFSFLLSHYLLRK